MVNEATQTIAKVLATEVMDENYRGTQRIIKHGKERTSKKQPWKKVPQFIGRLVRKYLDYYGKQE